MLKGPCLLHKESLWLLFYAVWFSSDFSVISWRMPSLFNTWSGIFLVHYDVPKTLFHAGCFFNSSDIFIIVMIFFPCPPVSHLSIKFSDSVVPCELFNSDIWSQTNSHLLPPQQLIFGTNVANFSPFQSLYLYIHPMAQFWLCESSSQL